MKDTIKDGGAVLWNGKVISTIEGIPTEAELALDSVNTTKDDLLTAKLDIETEIDRLSGELAKIVAALKDDKKEHKPEPKAEDKKEDKAKDADKEVKVKA